MPMQVELVSPERVLFSGEADMVLARTTDGEIGFMPNHAPFVGALLPGRLRILLPGGKEEAAAVHAGFVEVRNNRVIVLTDVAEMASHIDVERARKAKAAAEEKLRHHHDAEAQAALERAVVRLEVGG